MLDQRQNYHCCTRFFIDVWVYVSPREPGHTTQVIEVPAIKIALR